MTKFVLIAALGAIASVSALGPDAVNLGTAGNYAILSKAGISTEPTSAITGDIGVSPIAATAITGFSLTADSTNVFATSTQVTGKVYADDYHPPTKSALTVAIGDMETAYTDAAGRLNPDSENLGSGDLGGQTLGPGLYAFSSSVKIPTDCTISGSATDKWIFQMSGDLTMAANTKVILEGGALASNIVWQVAGFVKVKTGAHMEGILLVKTKADFLTGSSLNGRILAQTAVNLQSSTVTQPGSGRLLGQLSIMTKFVLIAALGAIASVSANLEAVNLGTAGNYAIPLVCPNRAILSKAGISTEPTSAITGDIGVSPIAATAITGHRESVRRRLPPPTKSALTVAIGDMETAYTDAAGRLNPDSENLGSGDLGGQTLGPGLYAFSSSVKIPTDCTISGSATDKWIFQMSGDLTMAANTKVILEGGALASNIVWQVAGFVKVKTGAHMEGILLVKTKADFLTGSSLNGRILAQTAVNLQSSTVTQPGSGRLLGQLSIMTKFVLIAALGAIASVSANLEAVNLGTAGNYAILSKAGISTEPTSAITGDIGVSPIAATAITGHRESVRRRLPPPTKSALTVAIGDMETAYTDAAGRLNPDSENLGSGDLGGQTLGPGLYAFSSSVKIPTDCTISGSATDKWIFQMSGDLTMAANTKVILEGGALASNIVWQVAGFVKVKTGAHMEGILLVKTKADFLTGSSLNGRILAQTAVNLQSSTVTQPGSGRLLGQLSIMTKFVLIAALGAIASVSANLEAVNLGTAGNYAILSKAGISTEPTSAITGDIGVSPIAATAITGFSLTADSTNVFATSTQVTGKVYADDYHPPTKSALTVAIGDMETAYTDAAGRLNPDSENLGSGDLGGQTLGPGLYAFSSSVKIPTDCTISGSATDKWIFQMSGDLTMAANTKVILEGGALASNIVWQVAGFVKVKTGAHMEGILLVKTKADFLTGSSLNGRILAQTAVNLQSSTVTQPGSGRLLGQLSIMTKFVLIAALGAIASVSANLEAVNLGTAGNYAILSKAGISTEPTSAITGDIGVSPIAATAITGFSLTADSTNVFATSTQVTGKVYADDYHPPTKSALTVAIGDMETAYTDAAGRLNPDSENLGSGDLGGQTLGPGLYAFSSSVKIPTDCTISGSATDKWIFQMSGDLTMAANTKVILEGGALASNIVWQVAGFVKVKTGAHMEGILLVKTKADFLTGSSLNGRILAQTAVNLQSSTVTQPGSGRLLGQTADILV
ncbi:unnamed protein product [Polarella glacialis]|uniref:Ice-binding protein n=2 Tax=Polarella glacialis TaxID=89957 RepID=A0A813G078_POLGL|nr:unnamed protein product [Polarella glacialis]